MNINLLDEQQLEKLRSLIAESEHIVICAHKSPDGDAVGSSLAWKAYLQQLGKTDVKVCLPDAFPDFLQWMPGTQEIVRYDKRPALVQQIFDNADLVCCLDFNQITRVDDMCTVLESCKAKRLLIDHHLEPDTNNELTLSFPKLSSTSELLFSLIWQMGGYEDMTKACAQCIYCGMMTDTGGFTYNSTRPEIYFIVSQLLSKRIDKDNIYNRVYHNYSSNAIKFRGHIICNKLNIVEELHAAYFAVTKEEMRQFKFIKGDLEGVVNIPQQIKGLKLSISLREDTEKPNLVLVSLRSGNGFHCQPMAVQFFNGGGHADASGGKLHCSIQEAEQIALNAILAFKDQLK
ncbi:bifunctional oligoribonuclease/PAP phosphatase NrnA [Prevotella sp. HUN102]|uniref:DHH family phosphoesterase n=1 Tax=Prevotella sp. HUN102 TaxID=1392486 RepID=UPI00048AB8D6|nr:DHH family phosphoesterase [Prevotella sp. HUN102]